MVFIFIQLIACLGVIDMVNHYCAHYSLTDLKLHTVSLKHTYIHSYLYGRKYIGKAVLLETKKKAIFREREPKKNMAAIC